MDNKNVFVAIALSMSVLLFWAAFFEQPKQINTEKKSEQSQKSNENVITPNISESLQINNISREDSIQKSQRVKIENNSIVGSLNLEGGVIDDISFKKHKQDLKENQNVEFLNPADTENGFFVETGWTSIGNKIKVPTKKSKWIIKGNKILDNNQPIVLQWDNGEGIIFSKKINLDDKYLFTISQEVKNNTNKNIELYPYAQMTRNKIPDDIQNFYISHEGFIGVFDEELKEDDYSDIEENKIVREADEGWLGITDKYWMTALYPQRENFKDHFFTKIRLKQIIF